MTLPEFDRTWTLFLDRDGVLNRKIENGYVLNCSMLDVLPGTSTAVEILGGIFGAIVVVTNQRGVARGLMSHADLEAVHQCLKTELGTGSRHIKSILACTHDVNDQCNCRKPKPGLALQAQALFPEIDFARSVMVGDSQSDMEFGASLGMKLVRISAAPQTSGTTVFTPSLIKWAQTHAIPMRSRDCDYGDRAND
jgi:D-glycero-D-manno-heptose 1,7-bisphosphate phosphatase